VEEQNNVQTFITKTCLQYFTMPMNYKYYTVLSARALQNALGFSNNKTSTMSQKSLLKQNSINED